MPTSMPHGAKMPERPVTLDPRLGHALNRALLEGDVAAAMSCLARYLADIGWKVPATSINELARDGLVGTR